MNLVKYLRKNQTRIMVFVVIALMIAFVGGTALQQILMRLGGGGNRAVATYKGGKITELQMMEASSQLDLLRNLKMPVFLQFGAKDLGSILVGQLLFPDPQSSGYVNAQLKMMSQRGQFPVTEEQIDDFFLSAQELHSVYYWILLKAEAKQAGCVVSNQTAGMQLKGWIPALWKTQGPNGEVSMSAQDVVSWFIENGTPEEKILSTVADLMSILTYSQLICSGEMVTENQIKAQAARRGEQISAEYVAFRADDFLKFIDNPKMDEVREQFEKYKDIVPGNPTEDNPYGFGYKIPARVEFEYLMLKTDEVSKIVPEPTNAEKENFYKNNKDLDEFKYTDRSDPNNPVEILSEYSEIETKVARKLKRVNTNIKIDVLLSEMRDMADKGFEDIDMENATVEQLKKSKQDYEAIADTIGNKYGITIFAGKTGSLTMDNISNDSQLNSLNMQGVGGMPVEMSKILFSVEGLEVTRLGRFDVPQPKPWENIGPFKDQFGENTTLSGFVRVTNIYPAQVADDITFTYNSSTIHTKQSPAPNTTFVLKDKVLQDVKMLKAINMAKEKAKAFADSITEADWDKAVKAYNDANLSKELPKREKNIKIDTLTDKTRRSSTEIAQSMKMAMMNPGLSRFYIDNINNDKLINRIYNLLPADQTEATNLKEIVTLNAAKSVYVIKDISKTNATKEDLEQDRPRLAFTADRTASEPLYLEFFKPSNIRDRMELEFTKSDEDKKPASDNASISAGKQTDGES